MQYRWLDSIQWQDRYTNSAMGQPQTARMDISGAHYTGSHIAIYIYASEVREGHATSLIFRCMYIANGTIRG